MATSIGNLMETSEFYDLPYLRNEEELWRKLWQEKSLKNLSELTVVDIIREIDIFPRN